MSVTQEALLGKCLYALGHYLQNNLKKPQSIPCFLWGYTPNPNKLRPVPLECQRPSRSRGIRCHRCIHAAAQPSQLYCESPEVIQRHMGFGKVKGGHCFLHHTAHKASNTCTLSRISPVKHCRCMQSHRVQLIHSAVDTNVSDV